MPVFPERPWIALKTSCGHPVEMIGWGWPAETSDVPASSKATSFNCSLTRTRISDNNIGYALSSGAADLVLSGQVAELVAICADGG